MAAVKAGNAWLKLCGARRADRRRGKRLAALCEILLLRTRHLHGLTKPTVRLVRAAVGVRLFLRDPEHTREEAAALLAKLESRLSASRRSIILRAATLDPAHYSGRPRVAAMPGTTDEAADWLAVRIAAVVQIAEGLCAEGNEDLRIAGIVDEGAAVDLCLDGGAADAAAALAGVGLWNQVALRPLRVVLVRAKSVGPTPLVRPEQKFAEAGRRILQRHLEQLLSRQYGLAYPDDVEFVHETRVATRRLRAAIRIFAKCFEGRLEQEAAWIGRLADALGAARDADVLLVFLDRYQANSPKHARAVLDQLIRAQKRVRRECYARLLALCQSRQCQHFLRGCYERVRHAIGSPGGLIPAAKACLKPVSRRAQKALLRRLDRVTRVGRRLELLSGAQQHRLRIACKKLRYAAEFFAPIYPAKLQQAIAELIRLQDFLGSSHDADVYCERLGPYFSKRLAKQSGAQRAAAWKALRAHLKRRKRQDLEKAAAIWKAFTASRTQRSLETLIRWPRTA